MTSLARQILDKYATQVLKKDAVYVSADGKAGVDSTKSVRYTPDKFSEDIVLWKAPNDWIRIEFDGVTKEEVKSMLSETESNIKSLGLDYCITYHEGGVSPYINICNIKGLPLTTTNKLAKLLLLDLVLDKKSRKALDRGNLSFTWTPVIGNSHWKPKYRGAIHAIVGGINPLEHNNEYPKQLLLQIKNVVKKNEKAQIHIKQNCKWVEDFLINYCCNNELPEGNRHSVINKNLGILIADRDDQDVIIQNYEKHNSGAGSVRGWILAYAKGDLKEINVIELKKYIEENQIPFDIKTSESLTVEEGNNMHKAIKYFFDKKDLAQQFLKVQTLYYDEGKNFWLWSHLKKSWERKDEVDICNYITTHSSADTISSKERTEIIEALKQVGRLKAPEQLGKSCIQFNDKIIDIKSGAQFESSEKYFSTNPIPWKIGLSKETPTIDRLFKEWVGEKYVITLKEIAAYCMLSDYPIHRIFCFLGSGRNGKSKYLGFIEKLLGEDNVSASELDSLMVSRFEMFNLYKKLAVQMGETNFATMSRTAILKKLSGQDKISFEAKNKNPISDKNYAKLLISTNNLPETQDKSDGFYRRWFAIDFPNEFAEGKDILDTIPNIEYENFCNAALDLLKSLLERGSFTNEGTIKERMERYEERSNPFDKFFNEYCEEYGDMYIFKFEFRKVFTDWCISHRFRKPTDTEIAAKMKAMHIGESKQYSNDYDPNTQERKRYRAWTGIGWKDAGLTKEKIEEIIRPDNKVEEFNIHELI